MFSQPSPSWWPSGHAQFLFLLENDIQNWIGNSPWDWEMRLLVNQLLKPWGPQWGFAVLQIIAPAEMELSHESEHWGGSSQMCLISTQTLAQGKSEPCLPAFTIHIQVNASLKLKFARFQILPVKMWQEMLSCVSLWVDRKLWNETHTDQTSRPKMHLGVCIRKGG